MTAMRKKADIAYETIPEKRREYEDAFANESVAGRAKGTKEKLAKMGCNKDNDDAEVGVFLLKAKNVIFRFSWVCFVHVSIKEAQCKRLHTGSSCHNLENSLMRASLAAIFRFHRAILKPISI